MVTSKNAGLAVPDWPTTFGYNMFLFPWSKWIGGIFFEHTHRLIASTVGFLTIILSVWLWRTGDRKLRNLGLVAVGAVILQGILGGLRVTMLKDQIGIFHACLAQAFLGLIVFIALATTRFWNTLFFSNIVATNAFSETYNPTLTALSSQGRQRFARLGAFALVITSVIYVQLALGATMRHQHRDLAILDFPTANGSWIPDTSADALRRINAWRDARGLSDVTAGQIWLQMGHRFLAAAIAVAIIAFLARVRRSAGGPPALRRLAGLWVALVFCQIALGAWTIWSNKAADVATTHVAVGAVILSVGIAISAICLRMARLSAESTFKADVPERAALI